MHLDYGYEKRIIVAIKNCMNINKIFLNRRQKVTCLLDCVSKKIHALLSRLKINHVMEKTEHVFILGSLD
jgi:hypothetical protein